MTRIPVLTFGPYQLDEDAWELRYAGRVVRVQPKVLELLTYLVRHRHRVVPKQELLAALWPDVVVSPGSLMRAVSLARRALGDAGGSQRTIRTYQRRGYRFCARAYEVFAREVDEAFGEVPVRGHGPVQPSVAVASGANFPVQWR